MREWRSISQCKLPLVIGVTGHRDLRPEDLSQLESEVERVLARIRSDYLNDGSDTPLIVMSSLAEGADQLVARVALDSGAGLVAPLPMPVEEYRRDFDQSAPDVAAGFDALLAAAISAPVMPLVDGNTLDDIRDDPSRRALQYRAAGLFIVRRCHLLLALWDGETNDMKVGGAAEIVSIKKRGFSLATCPTARDCIDTAIAGPVVTVTTPRRGRPDGRLKVTTQPWGEELLAPARAADAKPWEDFRTCVRLTTAYNGDTKRLLSSSRGSEQVRQSLAQLFDTPLDEKPNGDPLAVAMQDASALCATYSLADVLARRYQNRFRGVWTLLFVLALLMAIAAGLSSNAPGKYPYLPIAYQLLFVSSFALYFVAKRRQYQARYLDYRALSETARIGIFWKIARIERPVADVYPVCQPDELAWVRLSLQSLDCVGSRPADAAAPAGDALRYRICRDIWVAGQYAYFGDRVARHLAAATRSERLSLSLVGIAAVGAAIVGVSDFFSLDWTRYAPFGSAPHIPALLQLLPVVGAAITGYAEHLGQTAQALQFDRMRSLYGQALAGLPDAVADEPTADKARALFEQIGIEAVQESASWTSIFRLRPLRPAG